MNAAAATAMPEFRAIYEDFFDYVWRTLRRMGVREADLADAAHEVFVVVHRRLPDFDPARPLAPWIGGIVYRVAVHEQRRARHRRERLTAPDDLPRPTSSRDPEQAALAAERARRVLMALRALDIKRRAVFVMHELDGLACPEIAEALGVPLNTVYSRLRAARTRFRAALERMRERGEL